MSGRRDALEDVAATVLRALPDWRGKATIALLWKARRERHGQVDGQWRLRTTEGWELCLPRGSAMAWSVAATGHWDRHVIDLVAGYIEPRTVALDVGASLGLWTVPLAAAAQSTGARLWCFEPNPDNLAWLRANIEANDLGSVTELHAVALGSRTGTARLGCREHGGGNAALVPAYEHDGVDVPLARLDDFVFPRRVSFIKLDVEGFEVQVLRGARALIDRDRPVMFGEFSRTWLRMRGEHLAPELTRLASLGYDIFEVGEQRSARWRPRDVAELRRLEPPFLPASENLLLLPKGTGSGGVTSRRRRGFARAVPDRERRCGRSLVKAAWRIGLSLLRRRSDMLTVPVVAIGGARIRADLRTPLGLLLYRYGFCPPEARLLAKLLRPGDLFVDGGANIGLFSLIAAAAVGPTGRVLACEPSPTTMALLKANSDANDFNTLELHEVALSDRPGRCRFTIFEPGSGLASFSPEDSGRTIDVAVTTLDALTRPLDGDVAVVKLDIEGAEAKALRGATALIQRDAPIFIVELEPEHLARQGASIDDIRDLLEPRGYEAFAITPRALLSQLSGEWQPPDAEAPNVVLAPRSRAVRIAPLLSAECVQRVV